MDKKEFEEWLSKSVTAEMLEFTRPTVLMLMSWLAGRRTLESQLSVEWDDEMVKEIERDNNSLGTFVTRGQIDYLLSLLKKERVDKEEWSEVAAVHIHKEHELEAKIKDLTEGIEKHKRDKQNMIRQAHVDGSGSYLDSWDEELYKLVEK